MNCLFLIKGKCGKELIPYFTLFPQVSRPSYIPFWGDVTVEKQVPLSLVIDIIIEQGTQSRLIRCLAFLTFFY